MAFGHDFTFLNFDGLAGKSETVTLSNAKGLATFEKYEILRFAQNDEIGDF